MAREVGGNTTDAVSEYPLGQVAEERPSARVARELAPLRARVVGHPVLARVWSLEALRRFQEHHVFAVWDFMCVVKRMEGVVLDGGESSAAGLPSAAALSAGTPSAAAPSVATPSPSDYSAAPLSGFFPSASKVDEPKGKPWQPLANAAAVRFVRELVLGEECDLLPDGRVLSHFELYLASMRETGAHTEAIDAWMRGLAQETHWAKLLQRVPMPAGAQSFLQSSLQIAFDGEPEEVAASLLFGREDPIPQMFSGVLEALDGGGPGGARLEAPEFRLYLERHIELDSGAHKEAAEKLFDALVGEDERKLARALHAAKKALWARYALWNDVAEEMEIAA